MSAAICSWAISETATSTRTTPLPEHLSRPLPDANGNPLVIDGLWGLAFGNGGNAGPTGTLYFTAGPGDESHGLFGKLTPAPEPATWLLTGLSLLGVCVYSRSFAAKKFFVSRRNSSN